VLRGGVIRGPALRPGGGIGKKELKRKKNKHIKSVGRQKIPLFPSKKTLLRKKTLFRS